ncbi:MOSC domain-containing protein [Thaumasiovibrio sp. DFM-14]|uniref:MOSC domain-containing protein n=1 Tax=Thaumasiovibrio sp. DFM-14 TaxID=3384792 RepID=UPI00399F35CA
MTIIGTVQHVLVGKIKPFARGESSAINKQPINGPVLVTLTGVTGDEQADKRFHGGEGKALHLYPFEHYQQWQNELGHLDALNSAGAFGENLSTLGITEDTICLNDKIKIGSTLLQFSEGRMPCWKLNERFSVSDMALRVQMTQRCGWYFRVLETGTITAGDKIELLERPNPDWPFSRLLTLIYGGVLDKQQLIQARQVPIENDWQKIIEHRIETGHVEEWSSRLFG